jgi:hypothetical protein
LRPRSPQERLTLKLNYCLQKRKKRQKLATRKNRDVTGFSTRAAGEQCQPSDTPLRFPDDPRDAGYIGNFWPSLSWKTLTQKFPERFSITPPLS